MRRASSFFLARSNFPSRSNVPPLPLGAATRVSRVTTRGRTALRFAWMAQASLMALAVMSTGCLITDPPQFKPPKHTRPFLDNTTALPPPSQIFVVEDSEVQDGTKAEIDFSADVFSQDDPVDPASPSDFQQVEVYLYIDLGLDQGTIPYRYALPSTKLAPGGTLETERRVTRTWRPNLNTVDYGCHTATLVASHKFDDTPCPACPDDASAITWQILRCSATMGNCDQMPMTGPQSCQALKNSSCAKVQADLVAAGGTPPVCSDEETSDGGTQ